MRCRVFLFSALLTCGAFTADVQVKTTDGQTLQGEYINTENGFVRLRTRYGVLQVPAKEVVTITAAQPTPPTQSIPNSAEGDPRSEERQVSAATPLTFPRSKKPDIKALLAKRAVIPNEPTKQDRIELFRLTRNYIDSAERQQNQIIQKLRQFGPVAYPFIASSYTQPPEIFARAGLLHALAVPGSPLTAGMFQDTHQVALASYIGAVEAPPPPPPDYLSRHDRERLRNGISPARQMASTVLDIENSASIAGGPLNTLLLLGIYERRYDTDTSDALLWNVSRDRDRLETAANDATKSRGSWAVEDRILLAEESFPLLFRDDDNLKVLPRDLLKKILPSGSPRWDAPQDEWVQWWVGAKSKLLKTARK